MNNKSSTPQTAAPDKVPNATYSPNPAKDKDAATIKPSTAAKGNDEVMSTPAKKS
jgi:hypothetical protein